MNHIPVLVEEFLKYAVCVSERPVLLDGTFGRGGHSQAWLEKFPQGNVIAYDRDPEMVRIFQQEKSPYREKIQLNLGSYAEASFPEFSFDTILLDLGFSSLHVDTFERGFSFRYHQPLDMRYNKNEGLPVSEWINHAKEKEIAHVLREYGEEKQAYKIARSIVKARMIQKIETTTQLKEIIQNAVRTKKGKVYSDRHPYVKTFQALRIFVNQEFKHLEKALTKLPYMLKPGGRLMVISFHSLEDRMVKQAFRRLEFQENPDPFAKSARIEGDFLLPIRKAIQPSEQEKERNRRSRSAKMRILERKSL
ncbi:MAG: 16S rRNA (cytosine(1402)-N(4))-methyltransferase RsmH [Candidatus Hydrogenedentota bacterium]|nr:MAG: 16S rRNA (cytosine(1402)-N(4))-methyltransferase RsmH [Candidatus Hydrogenedentota bacterium]